MKRNFGIIIGILVLLLSFLVLTSCKSASGQGMFEDDIVTMDTDNEIDNDAPSDLEITQSNKIEDEILQLHPWESGGKQPAEYTWEEFEKLSGAEQEAFVESFGSAEIFEDWENHARSGETSNSTQTEKGYLWENGGKQPMDYTWEEFEALSGAEQEAFVESFGSADAFEAWENDALVKSE